MEKGSKKNFFNKAKDAIKLGVLGTAALGLSSKMQAAGTPEDSLTKKKTENVRIEKTKDNTKVFAFKEITPKQVEDWNAFVDFVAKSNYQGNPELDVRGKGLAKELFDAFKEQHPGVSFDITDEDFIASVQYEMQKLKVGVQNFAERRNDPNAKTKMEGVSKIDGWPGSRTTQFKYPKIVEEDYVDGNLVARIDHGYVDADMVTTREIHTKGGVNIPKGAKLEQMSDGFYYFQDSDSGDWVRVR